MNPIITLHTPLEIALQLASRAKQIRLSLNLTQAGLAKRSGVSLGSLKRFEHSGQISLESLLQIALVLDRLTEFGSLLLPASPQSLDDLLTPITTRKKGTLR